jgi:putative ABC transport system ATP-binding protein
MILEIIDLHHRIQTSEQDLKILNGIQLRMAKGQSLAIIGASGSGKSTLLGLMAGLDRATSGSIIINGHDLSMLDEEQRAKLRQQYVAFVFQNFQLLPYFTAIENIRLPLELKNHPDPQRVAETYLTNVGLEHRAKHYPNQLSGGEQQRVAIARAFACEAPILFADEPTGNLDSKTGSKVADCLFDLNQQQGTTLILVTHDLHLASRCDQQMRLEDGQLVANQ